MTSRFRRTGRTLRRRVQVVPFILLVVVWVLFQGEVTWANVIAGLVIAFVVLVAFPLPPLALGLRIHPWDTLVLLVRFQWDIIKASVQIAGRALQPGWQPYGRILRVPLRSNHDLIAVINAEMNALVPGSVVIDVNPDERWMLLHVFNVPDGDDVALHNALQTARGQEERVIRALSLERDILLADLGTEEGKVGYTEPEKRAAHRAEEHAREGENR